MLKLRESAAAPTWRTHACAALALRRCRAPPPRRRATRPWRAALSAGGASCAPSAEDEAKKLNELRDERKKKADEQPTVEAADADPMPSVGRGAADLPPAPRFRLPPKGYAVSYGRLIRVGAPTPHPADRGATAARHDAAVAAEATPRAPPSARVRERAAAVRLAQSVTPGLAKAPPWWDRPPVWMRDTPWWLRRFAEPNHRPSFVEGGPPAKAKTGDLERQGGGGGGGGGGGRPDPALHGGRGHAGGARARAREESGRAPRETEGDGGGADAAAGAAARRAAAVRARGRADCS